MQTQSRIIYTGHGYEAAIAGFTAHNGPFLSVTRTNGGKYLAGAEAIKWAEVIETGIDSGEKAALCRAVYNA